MSGVTNPSEGAMKLSPLFTWRSAIADSSLPPMTRLVAFSLSLHMNERGGSCYPSVRTLAKESGLAERSVRNGVRQLEAEGWLSTKPHGGATSGHGRTNEYTASIPAPLAVYAPNAANGDVHTRHLTTAYPAPLADEGVKEDVSKDVTPLAGRKRDLLWEALEEEVGSSPSTRSERGAWNRALKELREAEATPEGVHVKAQVYRRRWPEVSLTPTALAKHWGALESARREELTPEQRAQKAMEETNRRAAAAAERIRNRESV